MSLSCRARYRIQLTSQSRGGFDCNRTEKRRRGRRRPCYFAVTMRRFHYATHSELSFLETQHPGRSPATSVYHNQRSLRKISVYSPSISVWSELVLFRIKQAVPLNKNNMRTPGFLVNRNELRKNRWPGHRSPSLGPMLFFLSVAEKSRVRSSRVPLTLDRNTLPIPNLPHPV